MSRSNHGRSVDVVVGYDLWAETYDALENPLVAMAERALTNDASMFLGKAVVELGCGTGRNAPLVLRAGARRYVGVDASPGMLARASADADPRTEFRLGDASQPLGLEDRFDAALFSLVLEHVADVLPPLRHAAALLAPGGVLRIVELDAELHASGVAAHFQHGSEELRLPSFAHGERELVDGLAAAGCEVVWVRRHYADSDAIRRCAKLERYRGRAVLVDVLARGPGAKDT